MSLLKTIPIKNEHKKALDALSQRVFMARQAFRESTNMLWEAEKDLFDAIKDKYPEVKGYKINYNHQNQVISLLAKDEEVV